MFKNDSQSIQHLLAAEKKAEEKVNQARKRKNIRFKQAKDDAASEIKLLKDDREKEFQQFESKFRGSKETAELKMEQETEKSLKELGRFVLLNQSAIIKYLLEQVFTIDCKVHENFVCEAS